MPERPSALTYIGHATVLIELAGSRLLTDPLLGRHPPRPSPATRPRGRRAPPARRHPHLPRAPRPPGPSFPEPPRRPVPDRGPAWVRRGGAASRRPRGHRARRGCPGLGRRGRGRGHPFRPRWAPRSVLASDGLARLPPRRSANASTSQATPASSPGCPALAGRVDVALVPIWGWGPRIPAGHLDPAGAAEAVARIRPRLAVPIHWGTLRAWGAQRGRDPMAPARAFSDAVTRATPGTEVRVLMPGRADSSCERRPSDDEVRSESPVMTGERLERADLVAGERQHQLVDLEAIDRRARDRDHPLAPEMAVLEDESRDRDRRRR